MESYEITCLNCKATRKIKIVKTVAGSRIDWLESAENANHPILSARERLDGQWGFQCACGNNDLMTAQEKRNIANPQNPKAQEVNEIIENLKPDKPKFSMVVDQS